MSSLAPVDFLNSLDRLAAGADEQADLFRIDLDGQQPWSPFADGATRLTQRGEHRLEDLAAGFAGLFERRLDDRLVDAVDLEIELDARDAATGAGDLEVHVAVVIFIAHDVGQSTKRSGSLTRPIEMPATGAVIGTPASIRAKVPPQTEAMLDDPFDS